MTIKNTNFHERFEEEAHISAGSERGFAIVFACVFLLIGCVPALFGSGIKIWALGIAGAFILIGLVKPVWLRPLNHLWFRFGLLLHAVVNPLTLGLIYLGAVVPTGLVFKLLRKDPLRLKKDPQAHSYWIDRTPAGPSAGSMTNQF